MLVLAIGIIALRTYALWREEPLEPATQAQTKPAELVQKTAAGEKTEAVPLGTDAIVTRNLFDPERGAAMTREVEEGTRPFQRVRGMVLLGTAIMDGTRVAILQDGAPVEAQRGAPAPAPAPMRYKVGDSVEGFTLSEINERKVVFVRGPAKVEVALDYFRKVDPPPSAPASKVARPPAAIPPRVVPNVPRRPTPPAASSSPSPNVEAREN